jgi:hypothetical protein
MMVVLLLVLEYMVLAEAELVPQDQSVRQVQAVQAELDLRHL